MGARAAQAGDVVFSGDGRFAGALRALLPDHLRRARPALVTLVILQLVQTVALLYLPRLGVWISNGPVSLSVVTVGAVIRGGCGGGAG
ncbi:hypothetical protein [Salinispora pacifica]|uniref:hypothetical protein n=1 Tax=Salinispora pacifica TaxID=351187 RepID=UPI0004B3D661|nr:hypothetical protein [Salinispora pacifica]